MNRGQHAAGDGSFTRSAGGAMARGIGLIVLAVVLGIVLLNSTDHSPTFVDTSGDKATVTTVAGDKPSTTPSTVETAKAHDPATVTILVANGSQVKGAAGRIAETLKGSNYVLKTATNTKTPAEASVVYFATGYEADARAIASLLTPAPGVAPLPDPVPATDAPLDGANILVVIAADIAAGH